VRIVKFLRARGREVLETREPGGTEAGEMIRDILLHRVSSLSPRAEFALYLASRSQLVEERVRPAMEAGTDVVCDRFADSSTAYQGGGRGLGEAIVEEMNAWATGGLSPDVSFYFDVAPETGLARMKGRSGAEEPDRIEREALEFHEQVRRTYLAIAGRYPERFHVVPTHGGEEAVWERIRPVMEAAMKRLEVTREEMS
jgi:dTMP kinase